VFRLRPGLTTPLIITLVACVAATAAAYSARWHWFLELFSHFRVQYFVVLVAVALLYATQRKFVGVGIAVVCAALNVIPVANLFATNLDTQVPAGVDPWVLVSANLSSGNQHVDAVVGYLAAEQAAVVALQEYTFRWAADLAPLHGQYPHRFELPRGDDFGLALYSRWPLLATKAIDLGNSTAAIVVDVDTPSGPVRVITVHLRAPMTADSAAQRARQFAALEKLTASADLPLAVVGDFNATPWSPDFREWTDTNGLQNGIDGHGVAYTWPTVAPPLWIPIDACVVNNRLAVVAQRRGDRIGSDHYPLVTTLVTNL